MIIKGRDIICLSYEAEKNDENFSKKKTFFQISLCIIEFWEKIYSASVFHPFIT